MPMAAIGAQMVVDRQRLWLPSSLLNRRVSARLVKRIARAMLPTRLDRISGPRASLVTGSAGRRLAGLCVLLLSLLIALPIPGTNTVLALTVFVIALGLIRGDGLLIAAGMVLTVVAAALMGTVTLALVGAVFGV